MSDAKSEHSLKASIALDFQDSFSGSDGIGNTLEKMNTAFQEISDKVDNVDEKMANLKLNVAERINRAVDDIRGSNGTLNISADSLMRRVEDELTAKLLDTKVKINTDEVDVWSLRLDPKVWNNLEKGLKGKVIKKLEGMVEGATINTNSIGNIKLSTRAMENLRGKLTSRLQEAIDEDIKISWDGRIKDKVGYFTLETKQLQSVVDSVKKNFLEYLSKPENVKIQNINPLNITSKEMDDAIKHIKDAFDKVDKNLNINTDDLKNLPNISKSLTSLRDNLGDTLKQMQGIIEGVKRMSVHSDEDKKQMENLQKAVISLQKNLIKNMHSTVSYMSSILKQGGMKQVNMTELINELDQTTGWLEDYVKTQIQKVSQSLISNMGIISKSTSGKDLFLPALDDLQHSIKESAKKAIDNIDQANPQIDTDILARAYTGFAESISSKLDGNIRKELDNISNQIVASHGDVVRNVGNSILKLSNINPNWDGVDKINVPFSVKDFSERLKEQLQQITGSLVNSSNIVPNKGANADVDVDKEVVERFRKQLEEMIKGNVENLSKQLEDGTQHRNLTKKEVNELNKEIKEESKQLVDMIVGRSKAMVSQFLDGVGSDALSSFTKTEQKEIQQKLEQSMRNVVKDYVNTLDNALGQVYLSSSTAQKVKQGINKEVQELADKVNVRLKDGEGKESTVETDVKDDIELMKNQVALEVQEYIKRVRKEVLSTVQAGTKDMGKLMAMEGLDINVKDTLQPIESAIKSLLFDLKNDVVDSIRAMTDSVKGFKEMGSTKTLIPDDEVDNVFKDTERNMLEFIREQSNLMGKYQNMVKGITDDLEKDLENVFKNVEFDKADTPIKLKGVVTTAQQKLQKAIKQNVEEWKPEGMMDGFDPKIKYTNLHKAIETSINEAFKGVADKMGEDESFKNLKDLNVGQTLSPVKNAIDTFMRAYVSSVGVAISSAKANATTVGIDTLHKDVRKAMAEQAQMRVKDFKKENPEVDVNRVMEENVRAIMKKLHDSIGKNTVTAIDKYKDALKQVDVTPNTEAVHYLQKQLNSIQEQIARKIKKMLQLQFNAMAEEIKAMNLSAVSIGYRPSQKVHQAVGSQGVPRPRATSQYPSNPSMGGGNVGGYRPARSRGRGTENKYFPVDYTNNFSDGVPRRNHGGDTGSFTGSVINTMRYITAGAMIGVPYMMYHEAWNSARETDYEMEKARQNFWIKTLEDEQQGNANYTGVATQRIREMEKNGLVSFSNDAERKARIEQERQDVESKAGRGGLEAVQQIALANSIDTQEVAKGFHIASRMYDDPNEAIALTNAVSTLRSIEELDVSEGAQGLESISAQWGVDGYALDDVASMMIKTANISNAKIEDLIDTQKKSGALFAQNLPGMNKKDALASSIALSAMFTQATARSGKEGGTFWKSTLQRPFMAEGKKILEEYSSRKEFIDEETGKSTLDPWNEDGSQKDFVQMFAGIMEASSRMDDQGRTEFLTKLFPQWHRGSAVAVMGFVNKLREDEAKAQGVDLEEISAGDALTNYIEDVKNVDPNVIRRMKAGMADTYDFRTQRIRTLWQNSTFQMFEELKDEFGEVSIFIENILEGVKNNAGHISQVLTTIGKILGAFALKWGAEKFGEWRGERRERRYMDTFEKNRRGLNEEGRYRNFQRIMLNDRLDNVYSRKGEIQQRREKLASRLPAEFAQHTTRKRNILKELGGDENMTFDQALRVYDSSNKGLGEEGQKRRNELVKAYHQSDKEERKIRKNSSDTFRELDLLDVEDRGLNKELSSVQKEMVSLDKSSHDLNNRMKMLDVAMNDLGLDSSQLKTQLNYLETEFDGTTKSAGKFDRQISSMGKELGVSDNKIAEMRKEVDKLGDEFRQGKISADQFTRSIQKLERAHMTGTNGIKGGGYGNPSSGQSGFGLMEMIVAGSMMGGLSRDGKGTMESKKPRGVLGRMAGWIGGLGKGKVGEVAKKGTGATKGLLGKIGESKAGKVLKGAGGLAKKVPYLGWALMGMDILGDPLMARFNSEAQNMSSEANRKKDMAQSYQAMDDTGWGLLSLPSKTFGALTNMTDMVTDGLANALGGNSASFSDHLKAWGLSMRYEGDELKKKMKEEFKYEELGAEARMKQYDEDMAKLDPMDTDGNDLLDENYSREETPIDMQTLQSMLGRINNRLEYDMFKNEYQKETERTKWLLKGFTEDSEKVKDAMRDYFTANTKLLETTIEDLKNRRDEGFVEGTDEWKQIDQEIKTKELELTSMKLEERQLEKSDVSRIDRVLGRDLSMLQAKGDIAKLDAKMGGAEDDSSTIKSIEKEYAQKQADRISQALSKMQVEYGEAVKRNELGEKSEEALNIQLKMLELQAQQKGLLADIKESMKRSLSTFNLPDGVKPMTYFEHMTKGNNIKNVTAQQGNVQINVNIDKMSGNQEDVEKLATEINKQVNKANKGFVGKFAQDVKAGQGANYNPWN